MARTNRPPVYVPGVAEPIAPVSERLAEERDSAREAEVDTHDQLAADRAAVAEAHAPVSDRARAVAALTSAREAEGQREVARVIEANRRAPAGEAFDVDAATGADLDAFAEEHEVEGYRKSDKVADRRETVRTYLGA